MNEERKTWISTVETSLTKEKGRPGQIDTLSSLLPEGITTFPLYSHDMEIPSQRIFPLPHSPWEAWVEIPEQKFSRPREIILDHFQGGCRHFALDLNAVDVSNDLFDPLFKLDTSLLSEGQFTFSLLRDLKEGKKIIEAFHQKDERQQKKQKKQKINGSFLFDPLAYLAGLDDPKNLSHLLRKQMDLLFELTSTFSLQINSRLYHHAGANEAQDLAYLLSTGLFYLRSFKENGFDLNQLFQQQMSFAMALDGDFFRTVAKVRAFYVLWKRVQQVIGGFDQGNPPSLYGRTSERILTKRDPWVNILRSTVAAFAGAISGLRGMVICAYDHPFNVFDQGPLRLARNTHWLLQSEVGVALVQDPAGGSYYLEALTKELSEAAWKIFQQIEGEGGMPQALEKGIIKRQVEESYQAQMKLITFKKSPITGVSDFPSLEESLPSHWPKTLQLDSQLWGPFPLRRWSEPFEALRDLGDGYHQHAGHYPHILLLTLGPQSDHYERTLYLKNTLAIGSFTSSVLAIEQTEDIPLIAEFIEREITHFPTKVLAISASEKVYQEKGANILAEVKKRFPRLSLVLAGRPRELPIDYFFYTGGPVLQTLQDLWKVFSPKI